MHRASGLRSRRAFLYVVPLAVLAVGGLVVGRSFLSSAPPTTLASAQFTSTPTAAPTTVSTAAPTGAVTAVTLSPIPGLGVKKGTITLAGPAKVAKGSTVVFVLDGPKRVLKTDAKAPFAMKVNTKAMPNGAYTLTTLLLRNGTSSVATTSTLQIKNVKPKKKKASATPSPTTAVASGAGGSAGGSSNADSASASDQDDDASGGTTAKPASDAGFAAEVLDLVNTERAKTDCKPLALDSKLNAAAQGHSADMATNNYFSHTSKDGRSPFDRITAAGYAYSAAAENIAAGGTTAAGAMDQWMNSPGHKANILNCTYTELGVGYAKGVNVEYAGYWTQNFGTPL